MSHPIKLTGLSTNKDLSKSLVRDGNDKLCVVLFTAGWCGPCRSIKKKIYDESSKKGMSVDLKNDATFFYVDVDENKDLSESFNITSIPHFFLMKCDKDGDIEMKCNFRGGSDLTEKKIKDNC